MDIDITATPEFEQQLEQISSSKTFRRAVAQKRMLKFLTKQTMDGNCVNLDQRSVARAIFGGDTNNIGSVATTALRLRSRLHQYYTSDGKNDPIIFRLPERSFCIKAARRELHSTAFLSEREKNHGIELSAYAALLESLCDLDGITADERNQRLLRWLEASGRFSNHIKLLRSLQFNGFFTYLIQRGEHLLFSEMRSLAASLGIHAIMLDPLLSDKTDQSCLTLTFPAATTSTTAAASGGCVEGVFIKTGVPREKFYGSNATYSIPSKRLADIDASFVYLTLDPFGHSDNHHHPGDELLIVLNGSVTIVFADSGTHVRLEKGAYAHFYAEQNHSAWNTSEDVAEVFIIRFYQLRVPATRQEMRQDLWRTVAQRSHPITSGTFDRLTWGWIIEAAAGRHTPLEANIPREISNPFGLARLLGSATPPSKTQGNRLLSRIKGATGQEFRSLSHWLWQLETAQVKVPTTLLPAIAKTYNIFDLLLLEFVFPAITSHVVVHRSGIPSDTTNHHEQVTLSACLPSGWAAMGDVSGYISAVGVTYEIPRRTLACSDIAITWLTLEPGHVTTFNQHTGSELILLFEGCVSIEYGNHGDSICCLSALQHCAHYKSNIKHRVCNYGDTPAQMLVVRFYGGHEELKAKVRHRHAR